MNNKNFLINCLLLVLLTFILIGCERPMSAEEETPAVTEGNLRLVVCQLEQTPFPTRTRVEASELCTHLNFAIYDTEGNRLKQFNQMAGDSDFGTATFDMTTGDYQIVALAHSSSGNPTMTNPSKIQFTNAKGYSDTFLYSTKLTLGEETQMLALTLHRIVALCRFKINDAIPSGVTSMMFQYKGGSGAFDASTGLGCVNSTQVVKTEVQTGQQNTVFDLYTFLHDQSGDVHIVAMALDAAENVIYEREFDVSLQKNMITTLQGNFFTGLTPASTGAATTTVNIDSQWNGENIVNY